MAPAARYSVHEEEAIVLNAAQKCISDSSLFDFKMSDIASQAGISIGSVYKHVKSKQDVLVALAVKVLESRLAMITQILNIDAPASCRLMGPILYNPIKIDGSALGSHLELIATNEALLAKASPRWLEKLDRVDKDLELLFFNVFVNDADLQGTQKEREHIVNELMVGLWSMHIGFLQMVFSRAARRFEKSDLEISFPLPVSHSLVVNAKTLINSFPWKRPLTNEGVLDIAKQLESMGYR